MHIGPFQADWRDENMESVIYGLQDVSAALAVFWSLVAVVGLYSVSALFGVIGGITVNLEFWFQCLCILY